MKNKKIGILLNCRLESSRLPNKALKKIENQNLIEHIIDRLKSNKITNKIILCIPKNKKNNELEKIAKKKRIKCYRGSYDDVINRLYCATKKFKLENVVITGGDNPLVDIKNLKKLITYHIRNKNDFSKSYGLPWGSFSYVVNFNALEKVIELKNTKFTEAWGDYFLKNKIFKSGTMKIVDKSYFFPKLRVTVDTKLDLKMMRVIYSIFYQKDKIVDLKKVIKFCRKNKEVYKINSSVIQKKPLPVKFSNIKNIKL
tara:strand:- start:917 stop:1684 length:768 start_codon:yes stop_codon:yes gene_type:complete